MRDEPYRTLREFSVAGRTGQCYSFPALDAAGAGPILRLPYSLRIILETALRNFDGKKVTRAHIEHLANCKPNAPRREEIAFTVARVLMPDMTGVPLLAELAALRDAMREHGKHPDIIEPRIRAHLVVDHSLQMGYTGSADALKKNMEREYSRNQQRYRFLRSHGLFTRRSSDYHACQISRHSRIKIRRPGGRRDPGTLMGTLITIPESGFHRNDG